MPALTPVSFPDLARRMRREAEVCGAIFDLPAAHWFLPGALDFSVRHFAGPAQTPVGPAAGPHTQLAQNLVLSWLAGGRILELKTVQVNDRPEIPRPCIHIPNVGYNVEWSQELSVLGSLREYAKAVFLIEILKATCGFGLFTSAHRVGSAHTVYDASIGYDLEGIRSEKVSGFLRSLREPEPVFDELRSQLDGDLRAFRDIDLPASISRCVTLSTFHGCPAGQVESIARYLLEALGMHVVIKFNPTLLGFPEVRELLHDHLGYRHLVLLPEAFARDPSYDEAIGMLRRLSGVARNCGLHVGAKLTNTLVVANNPQFFPTQAEPYMYLSGQPLHVIAMTLAQRLREEPGLDVGLSFSAGIDRRNFADALACAVVPVTTCTDLLRQGGYRRLPRYLAHLANAMREVGVSSCEAFVLSAGGHGAEAAEEALKCEVGGTAAWEREGSRLTAVARERPDELPRVLRQVAATAGSDAEAVVARALRAAGRRNGQEVVAALAEDPRYHAQANRGEPRRVSRTLGLYDCINCDLCITACPNDAVFSYQARPTDAATEVLRMRPGAELERAPGRGFAISRAHQLAVDHSLCNECSNCDLYCPEQGAPYRVKERVFHDLDSFRAWHLLDGFCRQNGTLLARLDGIEMQFVPEQENNRVQVWSEDFHLELQWEPFAVKHARLTGSCAVTLDTALLWRIKTVWESIFHSARPNMVNPDPQSLRRPAALREASR